MCPHGQVHAMVGHTASTVREQTAKKLALSALSSFHSVMTPSPMRWWGLLSSTQSRNNFIDRAEICKRVSIVIPDVTKLKIITGLTINMSVPKSQIQNQGHEVCRMNFCCCGDGGNLLSTNSADQIITSGSLWSLRQALLKEVHHGSLHVSWNYMWFLTRLGLTDRTNAFS